MKSKCEWCDREFSHLDSEYPRCCSVGHTLRNNDLMRLEDEARALRAKVEEFRVVVELADNGDCYEATALGRNCGECLSCLARMALATAPDAKVKP